MIVIGIDLHKSTHTATALDPAINTDVGSLRIEASIAEYRRLIVWAKAWPERTWAIENADGLGHHLALWLLALGEVVLDIPTTATARVRELSRGGRRKNDRIDAAAAASVAALQGEARQDYPETTADSLALLDERRVNLSHSRTRAVNQLHALLRELMAGGAPTSLTPVSATSALRTSPPHRPRPDSSGTGQGAHCRRPAFRQTTRRQRGEDDRVARRARHQAARDRRRRTDPRRPSAGPHRLIQIASADASRHRLSRYGDRQLNSAIYTIAMIQIRMPASTGRAYYDKKIAEGKTPRYATRALKRHLAGHLWRLMLADETRTGRASSEVAANAS
jgi:transposase